MIRVKNLLITAIFSATVIGASPSIAKSLNQISELNKYDKGYLLQRQDYIIQLNASPLASYNGEIKGLKATSLNFNSKTSDYSGIVKLNTKSSASIEYKSYLEEQQQQSLKEISAHLKQAITPQFSYKIALNGFSLKLTAQEADEIALLNSIKSVQLARIHKATTDRGPLVIQAQSAWEGTAIGISAKGEGILVGIIDTGIRSNHPSFAEVSPNDGYTHTNPLGSGTFLGYCATNTGFCNNKLIGAYNYAEGVTDPEDQAGHGTHVASTAAGNTLTFDLGSGNGFELTGVAPRANIIAYRIAAEDDATGGATVMAVEQAIDDGVDVINYSFGGDAFDPWSSSNSVAFRNARAAGIMVATSAGNSGPNPQTVGSPAVAPWITSVAASTHDRGEYPTKTLSNMTGGGSAAPSTMTGRSLTGALTASIVYAGNFSNGDTNPEQCLNPFPANTFTGQIVVCDRGDIARVQKAKNVSAGGAGGYVLANLQGAASFLADDIYVIPGIHIVANDGDVLKLWLASGSDHNATIDGTTGAVGVDPQASDIIAGFSSRGSNASVPNVLKPSVSAPGVSILAAGIGEVDYAFLQGTSMASPHVAGAAALIKQLRPTWSPGQIHSALVSTAVTNLRKENGVTAADPFDFGGGRIDINTALNAGLLIDETNAKFITANPTSGGSPKLLNLPSMADLGCNVSCGWSRTVVAAVTGSWTASFIADSGLTLTVSPNNFSLTQGQSQLLGVTATISGENDQLLFGRLILTPNDVAISTSHFPIVIKVNNSNLPDRITINSKRDSGQHKLLGITTIPAATLSAQGYLQASQPVQRTIELDSENSSAFDDLTDGINIELITVAAGSRLVFASTSESTATDLDLFVGFDTNDDGQAQESELLISSTSSNANEEVLITNPTTGTYWALVQNFSGAATGLDNYISITGVAGPSTSADIAVNIPSASNGITSLEIDLNFDNITNEQYYGALVVTGDGVDGSLGTSAFVINRLSDDVTLASSLTTVTENTATSITISIQPNSSESRDYITSITIPTGVTVDTTTLPSGVSFSNGMVNWNPTVNGGTTQVSFDVTPATSLAGQTVNLTVTHNDNAANSKEETASTSFAVTSSTTGGGNTGGGNTGSGNSSGGSGGGSLLWLILLMVPLSLTRKQRYIIKG